MSKFQELDDLFRWRLRAAALSSGSEAEAELERQRRLQEVLLIPEIKLRRADIHQLLVIKEELPGMDQEDPTEPPHIKEEQKDPPEPPHIKEEQDDPPEPPHIKEEQEEQPEPPHIKEEQEEQPQPQHIKEEQEEQPEPPHIKEEQEDPTEPPHIKEEQEDPTEPPHIKQEQEELWTSQEGEQHQGLEEADTTKFLFTPVPVKSEEDGEKPQSSQLHQRQTEQMETGADGEDWGGPQPDKTALLSQKKSDVPKSDMRFGEKPSINFEFGERFGLNTNLNMKTHSRNKLCSCTVCGQTFSSKGSLTKHMNVHKERPKFCCSICGDSFIQKGNFTSHMAIHTGEKSYNCSGCDQRFSLLTELKSHKHGCPQSSKLHKNQSEENTEGKPRSSSSNEQMETGDDGEDCGGPQPALNLDSNLQPESENSNYDREGKIHMATHAGKKGFTCVFCGRRFLVLGQLRKHMTVHTGVNCPDCGERFTRKERLTQHMVVHTTNKSDPERNSRPHKDRTNNPCLETNDSVEINFWKETRKHQLGVTYCRNKKGCVTEGNYVSKKTFSVSEEDKSKNKAVEGVVVGVDMCEHQSSTSHLRSEEVSVSDAGPTTNINPLASECEDSDTQTSKEKEFSCLLCGEAFTTKGTLNSHTSLNNCACESLQLQKTLVETDYTADRSFSCSWSSEEYSRNQQVQANQRIYKGDKPFSCSVCGKTFVKRESLKFHMPCHKAEKTFCCSICNTSFDESDSLVIHMRIHTGQTQFSCLICGKEFAWRRYLTKHMELHSKEALLSCSVCDQRFTWYDQLTKHKCAGLWFYQLREKQPKENGEAEHPVSSSAEHMETGADESSETEDSDDDWTKTGEAQSGLESLKHKVSQGDVTCDTNGVQIYYNNHLLNSIITDESVAQNVMVQPLEHKEVKQEEPQEPPHIKQEPEELRISLQRQTEPVFKSDPDTHFQPETKVKAEEPSETESSDGDFWKETGERRSGLNSLSNNETSVSLIGRNSCSNPAELAEPESDDSVDSDFWKDNQKSEVDLNSLKSSELSEGENGSSARGNPYICSQCGKKFSTIRKRNTHLRTHTRVGAFSCSFCGLKCHQKSQLNIHMRKHTRDGAFSCFVCGLKFPNNSRLDVHMRKHTGVKPFVCAVCGKQYAHKKNLQYHMRIHSSEEEYT